MAYWIAGLAAGCGLMAYMGGFGNRDLQRRGYNASDRQPRAFYQLDRILGMDMTNHERRIRNSYGRGGM